MAGGVCEMYKCTENFPVKSQLWLRHVKRISFSENAQVMIVTVKLSPLLCI